MATYCNILASEMRDHLEGKRGFRQYGRDGVPALPGTLELVWGKSVPVKGGHASIRVYTGINPDGQSRAPGKDAIRVTVFFRDAAGNVSKIGGSKRVHRVENWRSNLQNRLDAWKEAIEHTCDKCGAPMARRTVKKNGPNQGRDFFSCLTKACNGFKWAGKE